MIGWKVDVGYLNSFDGNLSIEDIVFTDIGGTISFATTSSSNPNTGTNEIINRYDDDNWIGTFNEIESLIGQQVSQIFTLTVVTKGTPSFSYLDELFKYYPGPPIMFPNFYSALKNNKKIIPVFRVKSTGNYAVFRIDERHNLYLLVFNSKGEKISDTNYSLFYPFSFINSDPYDLSWLLVIGIFYNYSGKVDGFSNYSYIETSYGPGTGNTNHVRYAGENSYITSAREVLSIIFGETPDFDIPDNPYEPGGPSGPTDPNLPPGTFDDESDPIPDSPIPTLSAANTGFTRIYNPTLSQVRELAQYLWTGPDVIQTIWNHIKQFFENPMEAIIGFNLVPVPVPDGGIENFALMYIDTGVQMTVAANQFVDLDCGTLELKRYYGSALDQSPYTKVSCYLPYIGTVNLNTDEVMGTTLQVKYRVDIVSGSCVAKIFVDGSCLYQYSGHCAITIPISSADFSSYVSAAISVGKLAAAAITAGAGAAMAAGVGEVAQQTNQVVTTTQITSTARNPATGRQITTGTTTTVQTRESPADQSSTQASFSGLSPQNVANTVGAIMSSKPHIEHSGSFSGNSGYLGVRRPFVIIERPNMCMPANYQALNGFPSMITMELGSCKGFTRVQQVQLTGLHATNPEQAEILELLKSGVIL